MQEVTIGVETYQAEVIVRLVDKHGETKELETPMNPNFVLSFFNMVER